MKQDNKSSARQKGAVAPMVTLLLIALIGASALGVDYGFLRWKRGQMQAAADTGALAGALAVISYGSDVNMIRALAEQFSRVNIPASDTPTLAVRDGDVVINTTDGWVEVTAGVTTERGNPPALFLAPAVGLSTADVTATARARIFCSAGSNCLKPWTIPDKFTWNDTCDPDHKNINNGQVDTTSVCERASIQVVGYSEADVGAQVVLKMGDPHNTIAPGQYNPVDFPPTNKGNPVSGGNEYRENIAGCSGSSNTNVSPGDYLQMEPGNMVGPTKQGMQALLDQDPGAHWDGGSNSIKGSSFADPLGSPRVAIIAFYDPRNPPIQGRSSVEVSQLGAFFIEGVTGNGDVTGRFMKMAAVNPTHGGGNCGLLYGVSLVRDSTR